ncbi:hypothetical protein ATANTOWER_010042 [Ataeniobius toweri]|uniref:Uncharacterized protein n=1 Tax=Ataeniobius toweri TaxID=208326 RepID=A0ABU7BXY8_9TELE|nr:hypothetical protein [Ataeniobius toweri]
MLDNEISNVCRQCTGSPGCSQYTHSKPDFVGALTLTSSFSALMPTAFMSSFTSSINLLFGFPHCLPPSSSSLSILLVMYLLFLLFTCPNHLSLASLALSPTHLT